MGASARAAAAAARASAAEEAATASGAAPPHAAGTPGPVALALHDLLVRDFETNEAELVDVPYELFEDERSDE